MRTFVCLVAVLLLSACSTTERSAISPETFDPATATVSSAEAVEIAQSFLAAQSFAAEYETEPSDVGTFGTSWLVSFPLKTIDRVPHETAIAVDTQTGVARLVPLE